MINENELMISNKSYVNKDFATIYPELLDYVKDLTNKWNPQTSNESDPGIVLLKLLGFMGDKLNYNIDKNVLEDFVLSCTQESSMRKNLYPLGYNMKYYQSATTDVQFTYVGDKLDSQANNKSFTLPPLKTIITSDDNSVQFVLVDEATIEGKNIPTYAKAIQGRVDTLVVGDSDVIQLENIDSNNRIYFPISMVAENGVFIHRVGFENEIWDRVDNLNTLTPHLEVFMFGFDSARGLPYIEFPEDIVDIIGNGLHIDYIITDGLDGNISAKTLTKIASPDSVEIKNSGGEEITFNSEDEESLLLIKNLNASIDGANPETIDDAYNNFKKTIGTFDTLVTCRDYANYIYNIYDNTNKVYVVSNAQVSDRRDDITYSTGVVSYDVYGQKKVNVTNTINEDITAYDLFLYPLNPVSSYTIDGYNDSFKPLGYNNVSSKLKYNQTIAYVEDRLENSKCASHNYFDFKTHGFDVYAFKNMLKLDAKIATTHKVTNYERKDIIENVISALIKTFNARQVDYGNEIPYNKILETIEGADTRISYVNLLDPELSTTILTANGNEYPLISSSGLNFIISLLAHNILNGNVELFSYDDDFNYDFGQNKITNKQMKLTNLKYIKSETKIPLPNGVATGKDYGYKLLDNEAIQLIAPSIITDISYTAYTLYCAQNLNSTIARNTNHKLTGSEVLWIYYTDASTKKVVVKKYVAGDIIQPNEFDLTNTPSSGSGTTSKTFIYDGTEITCAFLALGASESIDIRRVNITKFKKPTYFYWIRNNSDNKLFTDADIVSGGFESILGDGEYLFYTDEGFNNLVSLGSGTTIRTNINSNPSVDRITYQDIEDEGLLGLKDKWYQLNLTEANNPGHGTWLEVQENIILTLTQGDTITVTKTGSSGWTLGNDLQPLEDCTIEYTFNDGTEAEPLEKYDIGEAGTWQIKSRLDINAGKNYSQRINTSYQTIEFYDKDYDPALPSASHHVTLDSVDEQFNLNESYQFIGEDYIDVSSKDISTNKTIYPFSMYCYVSQTSGGEVKTLDRGSDGYVSYSVTSSEAFDFDMPNVEEYKSGLYVGEYKLLMLYVTLGEEGTTLTLTPTGGKIRPYNKWVSDALVAFSTSLTITSDGIYNIEFEPGVTHLQISSNKTKATTLSIDYIKYIKGVDYNNDLDLRSYGLNSSLGITDALAKSVSEDTSNAYKKSEIEEKLLKQINTLDDSTAPKFYYTNRVSNSKVIEQDNLLAPLAFYDVNNVANKFTISQIDMSTISGDIDIMRSSRL